MAIQQFVQSRPDSPRGMAVVSMLMLMAVIAVMAAAVLSRQAAFIRAAQSEQTLAQARWALRGELERAQWRLRSDGRREVAVRLDGAWSRPTARQAPMLFEGVPAEIVSEISDEQAKFNLRNLVVGGRLDTVEGGAFLNLCALLGVPPDQAARIARRVVSGLVQADPPSAGLPAADDPDQERAVAEALGLTRLPSLELAPRIRVLDDLLAVPGVTAETVDRLRPFVTVLPARTWINANTASPEVLAAWVPGLTLDHARALLQKRDQGQWFINRGDFVHRLQMPGLEDSTVLIGITSKWFRISAALRMSRTTLLMQALVQDDKDRFPQIVWLREGA